MNFSPDELPEKAPLTPSSEPVEVGSAWGRTISPVQIEQDASGQNNSLSLKLLAPPPRDPDWDGWDVLRIMLMFVVSLIASLVAMLAFVPGPNLKSRLLRFATIPSLGIVAQFLAYLLLLGYMYILVTKERGRPRFWDAIHWHWPANFGPFLAAGFALQIVFIFLERFLTFPKQTPFDELLRQRAALILILTFATTLGPLMEELFFRAFLYPVVARRFGIVTGVLATALPFGLMHAAQYGYSWASVLLVSVVGVVLGAVRAAKDSVAACFIVHVAYNGTISLMLLIATDGFRHLEKLNR
jgi:uncharacterized protein